jgi:hypothetical protein
LPFNIETQANELLRAALGKETTDKKKSLIATNCSLLITYMYCNEQLQQ